MKVSTIKPLILTTNAEKLIKVYSALGFKKKHVKDDIEILNSTTNCTILVDDNDNRIYISQADNIPKEMTVIHINVDNFDEAYEHFKSEGYYDAKPQITRSATSISQLMFCKTGTGVIICQHIK